MQFVRTAMWLIGWSIAAASGLVTILVAFGWLPSAANLQHTYAPATASIYDFTKTEKAAAQSPDPVQIQSQLSTAGSHKASLNLGVGQGTIFFPSFDCHVDTGWSEQTICHSEVLSRYDREVHRLYQLRRAALSDPERELLRQEEIAWLKQRSACQYNTSGFDCVKQALEGRIAQLGGTVE